MTDANITAIIVGIPVIVTSLANVFLNLRANRKQDVASDKQDIANDKQDKTNEKIVEIHTSTNGTLSELRKEAAESKAEIIGLKALIAEKNASKEAIANVKEIKDDTSKS